MGDQELTQTTIDFSQRIAQEFEESSRVKKQAIESQMAILNQAANVLLQALQSGNKVLLFGNGGSAADSQHIASELVSKFKMNRKAFPAIALTTDTSILTSIANDFNYDYVFARQIEALGQKGDVALGISTSGNSANVIKGAIAAKELGLTTIGFTGAGGGKLKEYVDLCLMVPSQVTARIQEVHITAAHAICTLVEEELCADNSNTANIFQSR